jgi:hypothetical protein
MSMKEHPIIFSAPMVRAILAGTKTMTRRLVKPQPEYWQCGERNGKVVRLYTWQRNGTPARGCEPCEYNGYYPQGKPGDRLWVRETWRPVLSNVGTRIMYRADGEGPRWAVWHPSIFMPRRASRITLEITDVQMERLQDITDQDARAEGCAIWTSVGGRTTPLTVKTARDEFAELWDRINGKRAPWYTAPMVWVIGFRRVTP